MFPVARLARTVLVNSLQLRFFGSFWSLNCKTSSFSHWAHYFADNTCSSTLHVKKHFTSVLRREDVQNSPWPALALFVSRKLSRNVLINCQVLKLFIYHLPANYFHMDMRLLWGRGRDFKHGFRWVYLGVQNRLSLFLVCVCMCWHMELLRLRYKVKYMDFISAKHCSSA